jgi:hypothetical protein
VTLTRDPTSFVLGLAFAALGLFFMVGDRTAAYIGWMWPVPFVVLGQLFMILATRRVMAARQDAELGSERVDAQIEPRDGER